MKDILHSVHFPWLSFAFICPSFFMVGAELALENVQGSSHGAGPTVLDFLPCLSLALTHRISGLGKAS